MGSRKPHAGLFKPGQSGNPSGRKPADPEVLALKALTHDQFKELANLVLQGKRQDVTDIVNDQNAALFKRWLAKMADQGFNRGDQQALEFFLNRLIGKVPDKIEATGALVTSQVPPDELRARLEAMRKPSGSTDDTG